MTDLVSSLRKQIGKLEEEDEEEEEEEEDEEEEEEEEEEEDEEEEEEEEDEEEEDEEEEEDDRRTIEDIKNFLKKFQELLLCRVKVHDLIYFCLGTFIL